MSFAGNKGKEQEKKKQILKKKERSREDGK
jgi:hypothetical protein